MPLLTFLSLGGLRVRDAQLSDHEPVIDQDMISWNIMMPGNFRRGRYNNGFGLIEEPAQYHRRLKLIASVLAEMCSQNPQVRIICLQEAPVLAEDITAFTTYCLSHKSLFSFAQSLLDANLSTAWGLTTLINIKQYQYEVRPHAFVQDNLKERIQHMNLIDRCTGGSRALTNLHLPYESKKEPQRMARLVYRMISKEACGFTVAGDFNFSFTQCEILQLLKQLGNVFAPRDNSTELMLENGGANTLETVDAIISKEDKGNYAFCNLAQTSLLRFTGGYPRFKFQYERTHGFFPEQPRTRTAHLEPIPAPSKGHGWL